MRAHSDMRLVNRTRGVLIADHVELARSFWARARGLIGRRALPDGFALVIQPCQGVHLFFMSIALDVAYLDRQGQVIRILHGIKPWRLGPLVWRSVWVFELPAGTAQATGLQVGDRVELTDSEDEASRA